MGSNPRSNALEANMLAITTSMWFENLGYNCFTIYIRYQMCTL